MRLFLGASLLLVGCLRTGAIKESEIDDDHRAFLRSQSSGLTGCAPAEITVDEIGGEWGSYRNWRATCRGTVYRCSSSTATSTQCTQSPAQPGAEGTAAPSAAPAPATPATESR